MTPVNLNTHPDSARKFPDSGAGTEASDRSRDAQLLRSREILDLDAPPVACPQQNTEPAFTLSPEAPGTRVVEGFLQLHVKDILKAHFGFFDFEGFKESLESALTIKDISILLEMAGRCKSAERLRALESCEGEPEEGDKPPDLDSVRSYAEFIYLFQGMSEPVLGVSPDGILGASWNLEGDRDIGLSFQPGGEVVYAAVLPGANPENPEQMYGQGCCLDVIRALRERGLGR